MFKKYTSTLLLCLLTILAHVSTAQTYCLKYNFTKSDPASVDFTVGLAASGATFRLGAGNLQFRYNTKGLSNPTIVSSALASSGVYNGITLTQPQPLNFDTAVNGLVSVNFDFTGSTGTGLPISLTGTDVVVVRFTLLDDSQTPNLRPYEDGTAGTIVYNDNATNPVLLTSTGACAVYNARIPVLNLKAVGTNANTNVYIYDRSTVALTWTTTYEKPNSYFVVERSNNGQPFKPVASFLFATYSFTDLNPLKATNKYRVKQVDATGIENTSKVVEVELEKAPSIVVFPTVVTDANGYLTLDVPDVKDPKQQVYDIFNAFGKRVLTGKTADRLDINVENLPVGTYFIKVGDDQTKFFKQ